jgi:amino acid adenylation domain-containing protein
MSDRESAAALRDAKREMLARLLAEDGLDAEPSGIPRRTTGAEAPLTHAQEVLWLLDRATPGLVAYNSASAFRLRGPLDVDALQRALDALVARHESLRTRFEARADHAVQVVDAPAPVPLAVQDLRAHPEAAREAAARGLLREHARRPFDLTRDHLLRATLVRLGDDDAVLLLVTHHIMSDAWSYGVMVGELSALYAGTTLAEPAIQFGDYAAWERAELSGERLRERLAYWRDVLQPAAPELTLPTDRPRAAAPSFEGGRALRTLPRPLLERLKGLASAEGATLYMVLLAAYQSVLRAWSGQDDLVTGSAIAGRTRSETEGVIGYFSAALPLRTRFVAGESFRALLGRVRATVLGALEHQDVPFEALVHELQAQGRPGHAPLFQCVLTMQENQGGRLELDGVAAEPFEVEAGTTKFDLTLLPAERPEGLELLLWYRSDLFDQATADRLLGHLATFLDAAAADPSTPVDALPLMTGEERAQLAAWNDTARDLGAPTTITALIRAAAERDPSATAVVSGDASLTWAELASRGHQLARRLQASGVGPDVPVGLCLERSADLIVGMYGILAAGGAYVPLLPDQPAARVAQQLRESGAPVVVTTAAHRALVGDARVVLLDADAAELAALPDDAPPSAAGPEHLAYVIFTSGSTGVPKGVAVTHANLVHYTRAIADVLGLDLAGGARWQCATVSTLAADLGHTSVFPALASAGTLHVLPPDVVTDAARFQAYAASHAIDLLKITPSHLQALAGPELRPEHLPARWLVLGGEPCPWALVERVRAAGRCRVLNHYGPTETTVGASVFEVGATDVSAWAPATVPIGRPLPNATTHVLDRGGRPAPVGVPGELWVGGQGVARGYLRRDELTRERFAPAFAGATGRMYRTGDRARRLPTGDVEFLGRVDDQVKVRGHRVELGEIEAVLARHPRVRQAVVALRDDQLVGYVVPTSESVDDAALAAHVAAELPDYMVPAAWVRLHTVPLNANGKVDRNALPAPVAPEAAIVDGAPRGDVEVRLAALWAEVLKRDAVGVHDNFFALGGHSLLAIRLLGRIAKTFGQRLSLRALFEHPTIATLAPLVGAAKVNS